MAGCGRPAGRDHHRPGSAPMAINPLKYRLRVGQTSAIALVFAWEWFFNPPDGPMALALSAASLAFQLGMCVFPVPCCLAVQAVFVATCLSGQTSGPSQLLAVALAAGTMAYDMKLRWVLAVSVPVLGSLIWQSTIQPVREFHPAHNDVPVLVFLLYLVVFFGYTSRQRAEIMDTRAQARRAEELRRRVEVARLVHDSVTGDLSNIARVAQRQLRLSPDDQCAEAWRGVNDRAIRVLDSVHAIIRQLSDDEPRPEEDNTVGEGFQPALRQRVDQNVRRLREAGFEGDIRIINHARYRIQDEPDDVAQRSACVLGLVDELFANIMRHGLAGAGTYQVTITCEDRQIEIVSVNRMAVSDEDGHHAGGDLPGGNGLAFHRDELERLGGVLSADAEDDEWILYARIPRYPAAE